MSSDDSPRSRILAAFAAHLREHGVRPRSVGSLARELDLPEREFYRTFASMDAVEGALWSDWIDRTAVEVASGEAWQGFGARERLLTFLFALTEDALDQRSLLLLRWQPLKLVERPRWIVPLEHRYAAFLDPLIRLGMETGEIADRYLLNQAIPPLFTLHLRAVVAFHLNDESSGFERTDAFIEKSVRLAFDVLRPQAVDSAVDFARFLSSCSCRK